MNVSLYYISNIIILCIWLPFFFSSESITESDSKQLINVVVIGCNLHSAIVSHELKRFPNLNVTLLEE